MGEVKVSDLANKDSMLDEAVIPSAPKAYPHVCKEVQIG
jgi:hypothetical protein